MDKREPEEEARVSYVCYARVEDVVSLFADIPEEELVQVIAGLYCRLSGEWKEQAFQEVLNFHNGVYAEKSLIAQAIEQCPADGSTLNLNKFMPRG